MLKHLLKIVLVSALAVGGGYALFRYDQGRSHVAQVEAENRRLQEQKQLLEDFVARLTSERRMADIMVTRQERKGSGQGLDQGEILSTTLMFLEYGRDGSALPPRYFTIKGNVAHIDALVIKFDRDFVKKDDPLRGQSIALFYRLYGDHQAPVDGFPIDQRGKSPAIYQLAASPDAREYEEKLWQNFWRLADDPQYRAESGVRVAHGEGPWRHFYENEVYTITLESIGGLSISQRPMDGVFKAYLQALKGNQGE